MAPGRRTLAAGCALALVTLPGPARGDDRLCKADAPAERLATREATLRAAAALSHPADRPRARSLYLAQLAVEPDDDDATVGLARVDEDGGCTALARAGYEAALARDPAHLAARVGLVDLLMRQRRWDDAERALDDGIRHQPIAPELRWRRGRLRALRGDPAGAIVDLDEALRIAPDDGDIQETRARVAMGQVRVGQRLQLFPSGYDDVSTTDVTAMQRYRQMRFEAGVTVLSRSGGERPTRTGPRQTNLVDGRPTLGAYLHTRSGGYVGGSIGYAVPALSLPRYAFELGAGHPISARLSAQGTAAYWMYADDRDVLVLSPALTIALTDRLDITPRYWSTTVFVGGAAPQTDSVSSVGLRAALRLDERFTVGIDYVYGLQIERLPGVVDLLDLRSHVVSLLGRWQIDHTFGLDASLAIERRESLRSGAYVFGPGFEVGAFARW